MTALQKQGPGFEQLLASMKDQIAVALPKHMTADRMSRLALTAFRTVKGLNECTPVSIVKAVMESAQLGLEANVQGQSYLIPFRNKDGTKECTMIPGYRGLMQLARRSGEIKSLDAFVVFEGDDFSVEMGTTPNIQHKPKFSSDKPLYYYAVCLLKDGGVQFSIMSYEQIEAHRKRYSKMPNSPAWVDSFDEMAKKTVLRKLCKMIPQSVELMDALQYEDNKFYKEQTIDLTPDERKERFESAHEANAQLTTDQKTVEDLKAITERFKRLNAEAYSLKIKTSDLYADPDQALLLPIGKLMAVCEILETRLK